MIPASQHPVSTLRTVGQTTASARSAQAQALSSPPGAQNRPADRLRSASDAGQLLSRPTNATGWQEGRDDNQTLLRILQEGGQIKRLADAVSRSRAHGQATFTSENRLKSNPVSAALAALMLSNQTNSPFGNVTSGTANTEVQSHALIGASDLTGELQTPGWTMREDGKSGGKPGMNVKQPWAGQLGRVVRSVAQDHIEYAAGQVERDFAARFSILYKQYDGLGEMLRFAIHKTVVRNADGGEVTADNAKALLSLTLLDIIDAELFLTGAQDNDRVDIVAMTCLRLMCYALLRKNTNNGDFSKFVYNELLNKNVITIEFVLEKIAYLLSGGNPKEVSIAVTSHLEAIRANIPVFNLGDIEDSNFRLVAHELDRMLRMLQDPKFLSGEVVTTEFEKLKKELGPSVIKRLESLRLAYWGGISPGELLKGMMALNGEIEARNVTLSGLSLTPDELEVPLLPSTETCLTGVDSCSKTSDNFGANLNPQDVPMESLESYANSTLALTADLYSPILSPRLFIDTRLRQEIQNFKRLTGLTGTVTPSSTLAVKLTPKLTGTPILPERAPKLPIQRFYTITAIATKTYLYHVENIRDADGRGFEVSFRSMENLLKHLEKIDLQGEMEEALKRYRENPKITEGRHHLIQSMMILRCLQYLENSTDRKTIAAVKGFLNGKRQAMSLRFHDVPVSGVFYIPTDKYQGIAFSISDSVFYLAKPDIKEAHNGQKVSEIQMVLDFGETEEFRKWIFDKIPYYDQMRFGEGPEPFRCREMFAQSHSVRQKLYYSPFSFISSSNRGEIVSRLNTDEMSRLASDIDTLVFSASEQRLQEWLSRTKILAQMASFGFGVASFGTGSVIGGACMMGASLGFSFLDAAASLALARNADWPDIARGHYQDAIVGATLSTIFATLPIKSFGTKMHGSLVTIENVDYAIKCLRFTRNSLPDLTRKMKAQRWILPPLHGGAANSPNVRVNTSPGNRALAAASGKAIDSTGVLATISRKPFKTLVGERILEEIRRNHVDGVIMSTYRIDMGDFYVYTLASKGSLPEFAGKRLVFSAHGAYIGDGINIKELVPVPSDMTVSYLTPAGLALDNPTLSRTLAFAEVKPFIEVTQKSVKIAEGAAGKYGTPFDVFGHDVLTSDVKLREQYFSNFPYDNEAEINRALIKNYKNSKVNGKISDVAVVKPGKALLLSELLRDQLGYKEILLSTCRIFAVPGTTKVKTLTPEITKQLYLIMKRAYNYGDTVSTRVVQQGVAAPALSEPTYRAMIGAHDALAELPAGERLGLVYETGTRRYSYYELLRLYTVEQNQKTQK